MEELSKANCLFTLDLFRKLIESNLDGNIFFSPFSISAAFAMVYLGAKNITASQMKMQSEINRADFSYLLKVANRLYGEKSYSFLEEFFTSSMKFYGEKMSAVDFQTAANEIRQEISKWVELRTTGSHNCFIHHSFLKHLSCKIIKCFNYFSQNERKPVKTMHQKKKFYIFHIQEFKLQVLELPYVGNDLSMNILLPDIIMDNSMDVKQLEQELTLGKLQEWTHPNCMRKLDVHVCLPKFKLEGDCELKSPLSSLGMEDVFDSARTNLTGMSATHDLYVSKVVHKSFVEVNEEGTEAAGATAVMIQFCMVMDEGFFTADHPFLFVIRTEEGYYVKR
ncbi:leukocyte elastase inhibitor-like [Rhincodon typus]|uniref:leukocyte elastase inhibitor-like n=1 Tax=Rhincodon typus TaxID=259920 RepID=UPI002030E6EA|nr:leukocyte elastase inhibitor-like [Rhincodon typus]